MATVNRLVGDDGGNTLQGSAGPDLLYGFDPAGPQAQISGIAAVRVATGLRAPVYVVTPPGDTSRLFIVEKAGRINVLNLSTGQLQTQPFLDLTDQVASAGEQGLLGLAFHPDYSENGLFYIDLTNTSGDTEIRRYHVDPATGKAEPDSRQLVLTVDQPDQFTNHKGGWIGFGPDGYLYVALGDGGGSGDPFNNGQNTGSLLGKILRVDVNADAFPQDSTRNYAIPSDNPFAAGPGADEVWAYGLRNPWRSSFDRGTGDFFIADVGETQWEEVDIGAVGANYGWRAFEGPARFDAGTATTVTPTPPIHAYRHPEGAAITGGYVYRGESEGLQGQYLFADFGRARFWTLQPSGTAWTATERTSQITPDVGTINMPTSFGEDGSGNVYVVDFDGDIFRLAPQVASSDQGDTIHGGQGDDMAFGGSGSDILSGDAGADQLFGQNGDDTVAGGTGNDILGGGGGTDTLVLNGGDELWTITPANGRWKAARTDGEVDDVAAFERVAFDDGLLSFDPNGGSSLGLDLSRLRDYDGNDLGSSSDWKLQGIADLNGDGRTEYVLTNTGNGRWATVSHSNGTVDFDDHGAGGSTRVVGVYRDPLVLSGAVAAGSDIDSGARFANDLRAGRLMLTGTGDYDGNGVRESFWKVRDGNSNQDDDVYLQVLTHRDANIQYASYMNAAQFTGYMSANGVASSTWSEWLSRA